MYMIIELVNGDLPWKLQEESLTKKEIIKMKKKLPANSICKDQALVFVEILELVYSYSQETQPDYNKIIFMFEKIVLDMNIVPCSKNFDWIMA